MPTRNAEAVWEGDLKSGKGTMKLGSGAFSGPYSFQSRFESGTGTNPEELIAAAHAGCFTMAVSAMLGAAKFTAETLSTEATLSLDQVQGNWTITAVHLALSAKIPGIDGEKFAEIVADAKANCPVSRVLNAKITMDAKLDGAAKA